MESSRQCDVLVIGAGAGGISSAARFAQAGYRVLVVEALDRIGGRASTREIDGFLCNTGALVIERDGAIGQLYDDLGLVLELYEPPSASTVIKLGSRYYNMTEGPLGWVRNNGAALLQSSAALWPRFRPLPGESTRAWFERITRSKMAHHALDNIIGAMFAASADQLPADLFLQFFAKDTAYKKIGMPIGGTKSVWEPVIDYVRANCGELWLDAKVTDLMFGPEGRVTGARIFRGGQATEVSCEFVVSNIGPYFTGQLAAPAYPDYAKELATWSNPAAILTAHFASPKALADFSCLALYPSSRRLVYAGNFSAPELKRAPRGWHLYCAASVPKPSVGQFDVAMEKALLIEDIADHFPGFDSSMLITVDVTAHDWPAQRAIAGQDLGPATPIPNLWNVGDGVKPVGMSGTASCAQSAKIAADIAMEKYPLHLLQR